MIAVSFPFHQLLFTQHTGYTPSFHFRVFEIESVALALSSTISLVIQQERFQELLGWSNLGRVMFPFLGHRSVALTIWASAVAKPVSDSHLNFSTEFNSWTPRFRFRIPAVDLFAALWSSILQRNHWDD
jgi:hypothetical protein